MLGLNPDFGDYLRLNCAFGRGVGVSALGVLVSRLALSPVLPSATSLQPEISSLSAAESQPGICRQEISGRNLQAGICRQGFAG